MLLHPAQVELYPLGTIGACILAGAYKGRSGQLPMVWSNHPL